MLNIVPVFIISFTFQIQTLYLKHEWNCICLRTIGCGRDKVQNILTNFLLFFRYKSYNLNQMALECYLLIQKVSCFTPSVFRFFQMLCLPSDFCECAKFAWFFISTNTKKNIKNFQYGHLMLDMIRPFVWGQINTNMKLLNWC